MRTETLKIAGPYTISSDGDRYYVNGKQVAPAISHVEHYALLLDTGRTGSNGSRDIVGLTLEHVAKHKAIRAANSADAAALPVNVRAALADDLSSLLGRDHEQQRAAIRFAVRNGCLGSTVDLSDQIADARAKLAAFDADHPEIKAELDAKSERERDERVRSGENS